MSRYARPRRLAPDDIVAGFHCGSEALDTWLVRFSLANQRAGMATTFVITSVDDDDVVAFYSLATGGVQPLDAPERIVRGIHRHAVPVIVLARLAVHEDHQGQRLGRALLRDALIRVSNAADEVGVRALLVHAKDEQARDIYLAQGRVRTVAGRPAAVVSAHEGLAQFDRAIAMWLEHLHPLLFLEFGVGDPLGGAGGQFAAIGAGPAGIVSNRAG